MLLHNTETRLLGTFSNIINLTGKTDVIQLASVLKHCTAAIVPDSGTMHVAGVLGVPTIAIFGRVIPSANRITYYDSVVAKESSCPLTPHYCYDTQFEDCTNKLEYRQCMNIISVDEIITMLGNLHNLRGI